MPHTAGPVDDDLPVDVNVSGTTDHIVVYDLYWRAENGKWKRFGHGSTRDNVPDHYELPASVRRSQLWYSFAIGNEHQPNSVFGIVLTLGQRGRTLPGGTIDEAGVTNDEGHAFKEDWVDII